MKTRPLLSSEHLDKLDELFNSNAGASTWTWEGKEVDEEDGRVYVPEASYFGNTNIALTATHEFSGEECELVEQAVKHLPALIAMARQASAQPDSHAGHG